MSIETMDQSLKKEINNNFQYMMETIRFQDEDVNEYEIFSLLNSTHTQDGRGRTTANLV